MHSRLIAFFVAAVLMTGCGGSGNTPAGTLESGNWRFAVRTGGDGEVTVRVRDRSGAVTAAMPSSEEAGVPPVGGISVKKRDVDSRSLLVQVSTSVCDQASDIDIDNSVDGRLVLRVAASPTQCDAIGVSYSIVLDLARPVLPEELVRQTSKGDLLLWGVYVGDAGGQIPLDVEDASRGIASIEVVDAIPIPRDPPGIVALLDAPDRLRLSWLADACEDSFALELNPVQSKLMLEMRSFAIKASDCGLASEPIGVVMSFQRPVTQSIDAVLIHSR